MKSQTTFRSPWTARAWTAAVLPWLAAATIAIPLTGCSAKKGSESAAANDGEPTTKLSTNKDKGGNVVGATFYGGAVNRQAIAGLKKPAGLESVTFLECGSIAEDAMALLSELKSIKSVEFSRCAIGDAALKPLAQLPDLEALVIRNTRVTGSGLSAWKGAGAAKLATLTLEGESLRAESLQALAGLTGVRTLELGTAKLSIASLTGLKGMSNLELLIVTNSVVNDADLAGLPRLPNLREFRFFAGGISDAGIAHLAKHTYLRRLDLSRAPITDAALADIAKMTSLEELNLYLCKKITNKGLAHLARLPRLRSLNLESSGITGAGLALLADAKSLKQLFVRKRVVTKVQIAAWERAVPGRKATVTVPKPFSADE